MNTTRASGIVTSPFPHPSRLQYGWDRIPQVAPSVEKLLNQEKVRIFLSEEEFCYVNHDEDNCIYMLPYEVFQLASPTEEFAFEAYNRTVLHELLHLTGAESRLGRLARLTRPIDTGWYPWEEEALAKSGELILAEHFLLKDLGKLVVPKEESLNYHLYWGRQQSHKKMITEEIKDECIKSLTFYLDDACPVVLEQQLNSLW